MAHVREVISGFSVAPQITAADVSELKASGFTLLVNNRPDGEAPEQPEGAEIEQAARAAGLDYVAIPVRGGPSREQGEAMARALALAKGPVLAYCRSGTRSITTWAMGRMTAGDDRQAVLSQARAAGYDLSGAI